jgi:hypothetical protein
MPFAPTPRSIRDEVMFDLEDQLAVLKDIAAHVGHLNRLAANANRLRHQARSAMRQAQALEDVWDGTERRKVAA